MRSGHVDHGNAAIHYESEGDGPAVMFIHAGVADSRMWQGQMELEGHQTITFDQRGYGKTAWVAEPFADHLDALAVLDHLQVDEAVIVGCSSGGGTAMQLAIAAGQRVAGLVLVSCAARGWEPRGGWPDDPIWDEAESASASGDFDRIVELDEELWLAGPRRSLAEIDPGVVQLFREMDRKPVETELDRNAQVQMLDVPTNKRLQEIKAPTLVVVGEHEWPHLRESADYLAKRLSKRGPVVIDGAAHLPSLESPEAFKLALTDFLGSM